MNVPDDVLEGMGEKRVRANRRGMVQDNVRI